MVAVVHGVFLCSTREKDVPETGDELDYRGRKTRGGKRGAREFVRVVRQGVADGAFMASWKKTASLPG